MSAGCLTGYWPAVTLPSPVVSWLSHWLLASCHFALTTVVSWLSHWLLVSCHFALATVVSWLSHWLLASCHFCLSHSCQLVVSLVTGQLSLYPHQLSAGCLTGYWPAVTLPSPQLSAGCLTGYWPAVALPWPQLSVSLVTGQLTNTQLNIKHPALLVVSTLCTCFSGCQTPHFTGQHFLYLLYRESNTLLYWSAPCVPALWGQTPHVSAQHLALWGVEHPALLVSTLFTCFTDLKCISSMLHLTCGKWFLCVKKMHVNAKLSCDQIPHRIMGDKIVFIPTALNGSGCV